MKTIYIWQGSSSCR